MFLLGALFVGLIVALMFVMPAQWAPIIGIVGLGIAWWQWYASDTLAMRAMGAREVSPRRHDWPEPARNCTPVPTVTRSPMAG